ncbi:glycoside hydrolase family 38 C-terminal domain-containing protein [Paraliobacillus salinarum]|uniref:glycoside hydrolase family 38 N-terminal domain-containing protein n=1 Tax=Paraliobacillus salinarum TaxID=1158996 RepID=UPI0015F42445|nr:glycoside hydrolase family 38 C-terminal domain-containing protein [Paraliobacillus salinarum]
MEKKIHVIAHTHWDYEWYFTSNESFIQLCYHVDEVIEALEKGIVDYYMLDGQLSIVEDYLEANPDKKERLVKLVEDGKLKIGPWYTQTDQLIIRGESIVRNLELGIKMGNSLGGADMLGYIPDAFGQSIDTPKIFSQMGIDKAVFWRGLSRDVMDQREFYWESEDQSQVIAYNIKDGYFVGVQLIESDDAQALVEQISKDTVSSHIALPVGGDQRYIDYNLKDQIEKFNQQLENEKLVASNYDQLFNEIKQEGITLPVVQGELLDGEVSKIHRSIYSSRYDHKYLNDKIERRLIYQVEPLMALADTIGIGYKQDLLDKVWKLTLRNHAHDSAGGCNSDKTNRTILNRLIEADELSYSIVDYLTRKVSESRAEVKENQITIFNTLPMKRKQMLKLNVTTTVYDFALYHDGVKLPYQIIHVEKKTNDPIRKVKEPNPDAFYIETTIVFPIEIGAMGYEVITVVEDEKNVEDGLENEPNEVNATQHAIENDFYKVEYQADQINVYDKKKDTYHEKFLMIEDSGDDGDNYDYSPPVNDDVIRYDFSDATVTTFQGMYTSSIKMTGSFQVAANLKERELGERSKRVPYVLQISLNKDNAMINMHLTIDNQALDHRMRLIINSNISTSESIADTPFGTIARKTVDPNLDSWREKGWKEEPSTIYPMLNFVNIHDKNNSLTAFSKGIKEYQILNQEYNSIALTLFRSVGYLGKPDLMRRPGVASGNQFRYIETPDSQLQKKLTFKCSFMLDRTFNASDLFSEWQKHSISMPYYQQQSLNQFTTTLKYFVTHPLSYDVPNGLSLFNASELNVVFSSFKKEIDGSGYIIRFFNPTSAAIDDGGKLTFSHEVKECRLVTMAEKEIEPMELNSNAVTLGTFKPKEIKTISIHF